MNSITVPVVLGSATPSLESRARAQKGVYTLLKLTKRAKEQILPEVHLIDMRNEFIHQKGSFSNFIKSNRKSIGKERANSFAVKSKRLFLFCIMQGLRLCFRMSKLRYFVNTSYGYENNEVSLLWT